MLKLNDQFCLSDVSFQASITYWPLQYYNHDLFVSCYYFFMIVVQVLKLSILDRNLMIIIIVVLCDGPTTMTGS